MKTEIKINDTRFPRLTRAVLFHLNREELIDVANHGADAGWSGFTYHKDTLHFFAEHREDIIALASQTAEAIGEDLLAMVGAFNCLKNERLSPTQIGAALFGDLDDERDGAVTVRNAMAWFALEEIARELNPDL